MAQAYCHHSKHRAWEHGEQFHWVAVVRDTSRYDLRRYTDISYKQALSLKFVSETFHRITPKACCIQCESTWMEDNPEVPEDQLLLSDYDQN